jgi:hypothetical protein
MCASARASTKNVAESYLITFAAERSPNALQINFTCKKACFERLNGGIPTNNVIAS